MPVPLSSCGTQSSHWDGELNSHEWRFSLEELPSSWGQGRGGEAGWEGPEKGAGAWLRAPVPSSEPASSCPQVHGSRLWLPQVTPADSGEYVCRVASSSGPQEASVLVTIQQRLSPSHCEYLRGHGKWCVAARASPPSAAPHPASRPPSQPRVWCTPSASSPPRPPWPMDIPWTSTAWWPAKPPTPSPGTSVEAAYPDGTRY